MNDLDKLKDMELCVFNVCKCFIFLFLMQKVKHLFVVINIWRIGKVTWYIQCGVNSFDQFNTIRRQLFQFIKLLDYQSYFV